ncbi:YbjN domain-containing protein [Corynebacterium sp. HS2168-gen11]|uniref:YbjN domain-containing protein n=1 Tax=Corynebacterium sp. HS2168-gen11 TaxID=2974027 RepID=UPI00216B4B29|nr:YbjN domain-containing protein [Corynebacterium sp. HS2168-gen11]MCS4535532.1 YbjN domain-containing protein [Corynebacterium sp. HS2168-gen11]
MNYPTPLSIDRIKEILQLEDISYGVMENGSVMAAFRSNRLYFNAQGERNEVLAVTGAWHISAPWNASNELWDTLNNWNRMHVFPKAYMVHDEDNDEADVRAEFNIDFEYGVTDAQLRQSIRAAIATMMQLFKELENKYVIYAFVTSEEF